MKDLSSDTENVSETEWCEGGSDVLVVWLSDATSSKVVALEAVCGGEFGCCYFSETMIAVHSSEVVSRVCSNCVQGSSPLRCSDRIFGRWRTLFRFRRVRGRC
jgi:hypothetical protein